MEKLFLTLFVLALLGAWPVSKLMVQYMRKRSATPPDPTHLRGNVFSICGCSLCESYRKDRADE